ncbi:MAG: hypothetical protein L0206_13280 [Actinobacteria bacterium]|nr:hypothetical protein [Actinomycetota bacterium]
MGCVKSKLPHSAPAKDLYTSALFRGARCAVERSCERWFILSALHGLLDPAQFTEPYEHTLTKASPSERKAWSKLVLEQADSVLGADLSDHTFEAHAGRAYLGFGLDHGLRTRGAMVEEPLEGLALGQRLSFYKQAGFL